MAWVLHSERLYWNTNGDIQTGTRQEYDLLFVLSC